MLTPPTSEASVLQQLFCYGMMEADDDVSGDIEITIDDSLLQLSLGFKADDKEDNEEEEGASEPLSSVSYVEELKSKSDLKVMHMRAMQMLFLHGMLSLCYFTFF